MPSGCVLAAMHEAAQAIRDDAESGAAALSLRALDALREAVAEGDDPADPATVVDLARDLRDARPAMPAIANRVDRAMATADSHDPDDVAAAAERVRAEAAVADHTAARQAARLLGDRVLTLSRSGTAMEAIQTAAPDRAFVAESRPEREGVAVAEELSDALAVTLHTDAAIPTTVDDHDVETVVTGADAVAPDGRVLNKTGTRVAALAASDAGIPHLVVAARDKVARTGDDVAREHGDPADIYAGAADADATADVDSDVDVDVYAPAFDVTPPDLVTVVTEHGPQQPDAVAAIAAEHREHAGWDDRMRRGNANHRS